MTHADQTADALRSSWHRWLLYCLVLATLAFGFWGNWKYETTTHPERTPIVPSILYHTCQLLIVHGQHLEGEIPWQLHVGRLCGAALVFAAGLLTFLAFFRHQSLGFRLRLPWHKNHVVICGLGDLGLRLALDGRRRGKFVVAIEKHGDLASLEQARAAGILVLDADACDAQTLGKARIERAALVVAACRDDHTNVAIAALVGQLLPNLSRTEPMVCRVLFQDPKLSDLLADHTLFPAGPDASAPRAHTGYHVNFSNLDLHDTAARQAIRKHPLDFQPIRKDDKTTVHLVVVGFAAMGRCLARHAARIGHFANEPTKGRRIKITIVDRDAQTALDGFKNQYRHLAKVCDVDCHEADPGADCFVDALERLTAEVSDRQKVLITYAVCLERGEQAADRDNLRIGVELSRRTKQRPVQTLIYQSTRSGFAALFPDESRGAGLSPRLHAFGMLEDIYTWDTLLNESEDLVARALHETYETQRRKPGTPDSENPSWDHLPENLRDSNRQAADHIPIKLRALGYHDEPLQPGKEQIQRFANDEVLLLSQMEHVRWCAERWLNNWDYAPDTDRDNKLNRNLLPWDQLRPEDQNKDPEQINTIAHALRQVGRGIYR